MSDDVFELVGSRLHGKYRVDDVVGEGGFGVVYKGFHLSFEQPIAIKCLKMPGHFTAEARQIFLERFREEGKLLAKLASHGSVTRVYDFAVTNGPDDVAVPYLVLEWLDGRELTALIAERAPVGEQEALALLRPAVDALAFAHEMGVAHRDIKPDNLFLTEGIRGPLLKVLDFGIAKVMQEGDRITQLATKTSSGFRAFTPTYAAPEQINSATFGATGPWTDVHAIGLILTELVVGRRAIDAPSAAELYMQVTGQTRPTPGAKGAVVSEAFETLCARASARDPHDRFADAGALLAAMDATLAALDADAAAHVGAVFAAAHQAAEKDALEGAATALPKPERVAELATVGGGPAAPSATLVDESPPSPSSPAEMTPPPPLAPRALGQSAPAQTASPPLVAAPSVVEAPRYGSYAAPTPDWTPSPEPTRWGCWLAIGACILSLPLALMFALADEIVAALDESAPEAQPEKDEEPEELPPTGCEDYPSCERGCAEAGGEDCVALANLVRTGARGAPIDEERAFRLYERACIDREDGDACTLAGVMLLFGESGRFRQDTARATQLLELGCEHETAEGCWRLGMAYQDGQGVAVDTERAHRCFTRGCHDLRDVDSCVYGAKLAERLGQSAIESGYRHQACLLGRDDDCAARAGGDL